MRLSEKDREAFLGLEQASQFGPMPGRVTKEYVAVPPQMLKNVTILKKWIKRSLEYASDLPPEEKSKRK